MTAGSVVDDRSRGAAIVLKDVTRKPQQESVMERVRCLVELNRSVLRRTVHLIAGACYPFGEVLEALAEPMCVFPVEGLPGERYFPASDVMDAVETRAEELVCAMFGAGEEYRATIQPHSGTQANQIAFDAALGPDDVVLSLRPADGGHVSHKILGGRPNEVLFYELGPDCTIDYDALERLAHRALPRLIIAGGSAYPREVDFGRIGDIARSCGALVHADVSHTATFIAAGIHAPIAPHVDFITFNMVKNMRGPNGGILLYRRQHHRRITRALFPVIQGGANENMMFAKLVALEKIAVQDVCAYASRMVSIARSISSVLARRGFDIVTGGTDSHLLLVDLRHRGYTGADMERHCERYGVLVNRNLVPGDGRPARVTSGVRLGTSSLAILDYSDADVERLAHWIADRFSRLNHVEPAELIGELATRYNWRLAAGA